VKRWAFAFALLLPLSASAVEPAHWPATLIDFNCTDSFNAGSSFVWLTSTYTVQTSGTADDLCDSDNRVVDGSAAITSDWTSAALSLPPDANGFYIHANSQTATGGSTDWNVCIMAETPEEPGTNRAACCVTATPFIVGAVDKFYWVGIMGVGPGSPWQVSTDAAVQCAIPKNFKVKLDLVTATSWTGNLSIIPSTASGN